MTVTVINCDGTGARKRGWRVVHIPGTDEATARKIVDAAHEVCPYSNATRGSIEVTLKLW
jgi:organic hydroperoxide reductase OsmC/OhrA